MRLLVQCEGYKLNGERCRYHGMADVSDGMFCKHHQGQSDWRLYRATCLCASCSASVAYYFTERSVRFYCQWHKNMAPQQYEDSDTQEEESEEESESEEEEGGWGAYQQEAAPPLRQRPRQITTYGNAYGSGSYSGAADIQRFSNMQIRGGAYDSDSDDSNGGGRGGGGGGNIYARNVQINNHYHYHHHERREDCTI
ncbi:tyrosine- kinase BAZ1B-like isoform X2 [Chlorella sorokiniana]|uniref:Tyrosine-kinase BAZ1B-like isoform X2 n=1 Tax=Chlorella sorokiniana TaxID=3076 RepID=A0A2P6TP28_CHLSO|nr:tyrosine- kinase BAZ1B-like isoform X2 [Chlorella sorokiniana]|eukprot:PRW51090.1 tyrosine- kinase BAZ1B-like isoform X2 [Chlorella sorokiniana]